MIATLLTPPPFEPVRANLINGRIEPPSAPGIMRWGVNGFAAPPAIGTDVRVTFNGLGTVRVTGYFVEENYLGVIGRLLDPVQVKRNGNNATVHLFGNEIAPI